MLTKGFLSMSHTDAVPTFQQIREEMDAGLDRLLALLDTYSDEQMLRLTDAGGWNVRDHITHLFSWTDGLIALLKKESRWVRMGISPEGVASRDFDVMNGEMVVQYRHLSPAEARAKLISAHQQVIEMMSGMSEAELMLPYKHYATTTFSGEDGPPIYAAILETTSQHYDEHTPWIKAIIQ
jgi:hypothetical protein